LKEISQIKVKNDIFGAEIKKITKLFAPRNDFLRVCADRVRNGNITLSQILKFKDI
jgi:hypothetical protein